MSNFLLFNPFRKFSSFSSKSTIILTAFRCSFLQSIPAFTTPLFPNIAINDFTLKVLELSSPYCLNSKNIYLVSRLSPIVSKAIYSYDSDSFWLKDVSRSLKNMIGFKSSYLSNYLKDSYKSISTSKNLTIIHMCLKSESSGIFEDEGWREWCRVHLTSSLS